MGMKMLKLTRNLIVITGATSGIGYAILRRLYHQFPVAHFVNIDKIPLDIHDLPIGCNLLQLTADLRLAGDLVWACDQIGLVSRPVDLLVNNAGICPFRRFEELSPKEYAETMDVNLRAPFFLSQVCIAQMPDDGRIINIASTSGHRPETEPELVDYSLSKAGVIMLTKSLAKLYPRLRINSISPGFVAGTGLSGVAGLPPELASLVPLKRFCRPEEVAEVVAFLCSDQADYITGHDLVIDGGKIL